MCLLWIITHNTRRWQKPVVKILTGGISVKQSSPSMSKSVCNAECTHNSQTPPRHQGVSSQFWFPSQNYSSPTAVFPGTGRQQWKADSLLLQAITHGKKQSRTVAYLWVWLWGQDVGTLSSPHEGKMSGDSCQPLLKKLFSVIYQLTQRFRALLH